MARPLKPGTFRVEYKGVGISLYRNSRGDWEASFTIPGRKREKAFGPTQARCQENAQTKIKNFLGTEEQAYRSDEQQARAVLKEHGVTLTEAARYWVSEHSKPLKQATIAELRKIWLEHWQNAKEKKGYHYLRSLKSRSLHMEKKFGERQISSITLVELVLWHDELEMNYSGRTARNIHDSCKEMWRYGKKRGYLNPDRSSAMELVDRPSAGSGKREIYLPEDMQKLLNIAWGIKSPGAAALVLSGFGFVRVEELYTENDGKTLKDRICWEDFKWEDHYLDIRAEVAKTGESRKVKITPHLRKMLYPLRTTGPVYHKPRFDVTLTKIASLAGVTKKDNALRHSCITYAMLLAHNVTEVANKAGNSVSVIESNYRNRGATLAQAKKWFSLRPRVAWGSGVK